MVKVIMRVDGLDGQIALLADRVVIRRDGLWNAIKYGFNSQREIPLAAISEVAFRDAGSLRFGEIEFVRSGRSIEEKKSAKTGAVRFNKKSQQEFYTLKEKIFELMEQLSHQRQM